MMHVLAGAEAAVHGSNIPLKLKDIAASMSVVSVFVKLYDQCRKAGKSPAATKNSKTMLL